MKKSFKNSCAFLCTLLLLAGSGSRIAAEPPAPAPGFAPTLASNQVKAVPVSASQGAGVRPDLTLLQCGNLIYNGNKSSVCFADRFLTDVAQQTSLRVNKKFCPVRLDAEALFDYPFCVMSGNENFTLNEKERRQLRKFPDPGRLSAGQSRLLGRKMGQILPAGNQSLLPGISARENSHDPSGFFHR